MTFCRSGRSPQAPDRTDPSHSRIISHEARSTDGLAVPQSTLIRADWRSRLVEVAMMAGFVAGCG
jgi:hypothetical protein